MSGILSAPFEYALLETTMPGHRPLRKIAPNLRADAILIFFGFSTGTHAQIIYGGKIFKKWEILSSSE